MKRCSWMLLVVPLGLAGCIGNVAPIAQPCFTAVTPARVSAARLCDPDPVFGPSERAEQAPQSQ